MILFVLASCLGSGDVPTAVADEGDLELRLEFKGELQAAASSELVMPVLDGRPEIEWIVEDGTRVEAGDKLVTFDTEEMQKNLVEAQAQLEIAQTKIEQHGARLALQLGEARQKVAIAELDAELAEMRQTESETVPLVERETSRVAATKAEMATESAATNVDRVQLDAATELRLLELEVEKRQRAVERATEMIELATMTAPTKGLVVVGENWDGKYKAGSRVWPGSILLRLPDLSQMEVEGWVHEVDSPQLEVGQEGAMTMDAHPNEPADVRLSKIADLAVARGEHRVKHVRVVLEIPDTTPKMKPGMTVGIDLVTDTLEAVVKVPPDAVAVRAGRDVVWTKGWLGWDQTEVQVVERTKDTVVVEGIEPGTVVSLGDPER